MDIAGMRENYRKGALDMDHTDPLPITQFRQWFDEAVQSAIEEPNAVILATSTPDGHPSVRTMLLKGVEDNGFVFFTNKHSRKGREMADNPFASLLFFWGALERQVRIEGRLTALSEADNDAYFYSRPIESQFGAMASPQSQPIESRSWLEKRMEELQAMNKPVRPAHWGGFLLEPDVMEFWQGRPGRLHDRIQYILTDGVWTRQRLAP